jgi:hypothetical protein
MIQRSHKRASVRGASRSKSATLFVYSLVAGCLVVLIFLASNTKLMTDVSPASLSPQPYHYPQRG